MGCWNFFNVRVEEETSERIIWNNGYVSRNTMGATRKAWIFIGFYLSVDSFRKLRI